MVESHGPAEQAPVDIHYAPRRGLRALPVEVVDRSSVLLRQASRGLGGRERLRFHLLMVCTAGRGSHFVDFEQVELAVGTCLRIHPGQVHRFVADPAFDAHLILWPEATHQADPSAPRWFPGCGANPSWELPPALHNRMLGWVDELADEQARFDGSPRKVALMQALLRSLLLRMAIEFPDTIPDPSRLPPAYLALREYIESRVYQRPTVAELARDVGYSTRTLDRACQKVAGLTAKQVLDQRVALEVRRLLTHTDRSITSIAAELGFHDPSNFSKFVKRHLGELPGRIRDTASVAPTI